MIIKKTLDHLLKGNVILYPTDTSWGIGGASDNDMVVKKIFKIKKRNDKKALICLVSSIKMLENHVKNSKSIAKSSKKHYKMQRIQYNKN